MVTYHIEVIEGYHTDQYLWTFSRESDENIYKIATKFLTKQSKKYILLYKVLPKSATGLQKMERLGELGYTWGSRSSYFKTWAFRKSGVRANVAYHVWDANTKKLVMIPYSIFIAKYEGGKA